MKIAVLGGGVAGLVLSHELSKLEGITVDIYEKQDALGGFHKDIRVNGLDYDIGTFVFAHWHELIRTFPWMRDTLLPVEYDPQSIRGPGLFDAYPMSFGGYRRQFGTLSTLGDLLGILVSKWTRRSRKTLVDYIVYYIGPGIYRKSGLKAYIERLYQMPDKDIDVLFALQRMDYLENACSIRIRAKKFLSALVGRRQSDFWTDEHFVHPKEGFRVVYERIERSLTAAGVNIRKGTNIRELVAEGGRYRIDGEWYDKVVSTIPVPVLARYMGMQTDVRFECVRLVSLFYRFRGDPGFEGCVLFNFTETSHWKRITLFSRYYGKADGADYFTVECVLREDDPQGEDFVREDFESHARGLGLFRGDLDFQGAVTTPNAYPVFRAADSSGIEKTKRRIQALGIELLGRHGAFEYLSSSVTAAKSKKMGEKIAAEARAG